MTDPKWVTPPKLLLFGDGESYIGYWDWYYAEDGNDPRAHAWCDDAQGSPRSNAPTHWMPLPAAPQEPTA